MKTTDAQHGRTDEIRTRSAETLSSQSNSEIRLPSAKTTAAPATNWREEVAPDEATRYEEYARLLAGLQSAATQKIGRAVELAGADARGLAVKVLGVPGKKLIPGLEAAPTQDFLAIHSIDIPQQGILMTGTVANLTGGRVAE